MLATKSIATLTALLALFVQACTLAGGQAQAADLPPPSLKVPKMVPEQSVSTFVPCQNAPGDGLAVNIIYPAKPRYAQGAPVVVVVPGGMSPSGLEFSMHSAQAGFAEVRLALPGGGQAKFASGGSYDYRGPASAAALKDVLLFASGAKRDYKGRRINELLPAKVRNTNVGAVGWSNGGNLLLITLAKYASELTAIKWIAFYESPVGQLFYPPFLGASSDLILNRHYRQGSCATGNCLVDYRKLAWSSDMVRSPGAHKKIGEPEIKGVFYFDDNNNKRWDEEREFALPYAGYPGFDKQFYPSAVLHAADRLKLFQVTRPVVKKKQEEKKDGDEVKDAQRITGKDKDRSLAIATREYEENKGTQENREKQEITGGKETNADTTARSKGKERKRGQAEPIEQPQMETVTIWPEGLATIAESESYFQDRDGSLVLPEVCAKLPKLLVGIFGSTVDHLEGQPDHPHIAWLYNAFLSNFVWVRLNPDPLYAGQIAEMNAGNFVDNKANASLDAAQIEPYLEPEGLIPDYAFMDATVAELSDRSEKGRRDNLTEPLTNYSNGADSPSKGSGKN